MGRWKMLKCWANRSLVVSAFLFSALALAETKIIALGDSLTEGYGISEEQAYPALLQDRLSKEGFNIKIINAGVSGATSASGPSRLKWHLKAKPSILILALGANDGLRGISSEKMEKNLIETLRIAQKNSMKILFVGMQMPPNYGKKYRDDYQNVFSKIAKKERLEFVPFLLEGVAGNPKLNLPDGIHPNEEGHKVLAETIYKHLKKLL